MDYDTGLVEELNRRHRADAMCHKQTADDHSRPWRQTRAALILSADPVCVRANGVCAVTNDEVHDIPNWPRGAKGDSQTLRAKKKGAGPGPRRERKVRPGVVGKPHGVDARTCSKWTPAGDGASVVRRAEPKGRSLTTDDCNRARKSVRCERSRAGIAGAALKAAAEQLIWTHPRSDESGRRRGRMRNGRPRLPSHEESEGD
jgi:hypothetical protein